MEHTISILFYVRKGKSKDANVTPVYMRITVNGGRIDQTTPCPFNHFENPNNYHNISV